MTTTSQPALLKGQGLPDYAAITPEQVGLHIPALLEDLEGDFAALEADLRKRLEAHEALSWTAVMPPLQRIGEKLRWSWGVITHLNAVCNSTELREAHAAQQPEVVRFSNRLGQSAVLHQALEQLRHEPSQPLDAAQRRIIDAELLSMKQRGVGLKGDAQTAFNSASEKLAELSTKYSNNVLDATQGWSLVLTDPAQVAGLPDRALDTLAAAARDAGDRHQDGQEASGEKGPWRLGLDMPRYIPFLTHADNRDLRETVYRAHVGRASSGDLDNSSLIESILSLRAEQAKSLG